MQREVDTARVRIMIKMVDAIGIEEACPANDAVHFVSFAQQEGREISPVLTGDPGDQGSLGDVGG
jgi:hypothetical protein